MMTLPSLRARSLGVLICGLMLAMTGCKTLSPQEAASFVEVVPGQGPNQAKPFVMFLQGTGGGNSRAELWTGWFNSLGISTVIIDSARLRGRATLDGVDSYIQAKDVQLALDAIKGRSDLDFEHYAIMGFSRGATAALQAGDVLDKGAKHPDFVMSLYPGGAGQCPNSWTARTRVLVFYGELDDSGTRNGNRHRCKKMVQQSANARYQGFADTHHGYDSRATMTAHDGLGSYLIQHNEKAVQATRQVVLDEIGARWLLSAH